VVERSVEAPPPSLQGQEDSRKSEVTNRKDKKSKVPSHSFDLEGKTYRILHRLE